jgi:hypothetical protein
MGLTDLVVDHLSKRDTDQRTESAATKPVRLTVDGWPEHARDVGVGQTDPRSPVMIPVFCSQVTQAKPHPILSVIHTVVSARLVHVTESGAEFVAHYQPDRTWEQLTDWAERGCRWCGRGAN